MVVGAKDEQKRNRLSAEIKNLLEAPMNATDPNQPMNFNPGPTPAKKNNTWLIVGIVVLVLCCLCVIVGFLGWTYGDQILKSMQGSTSALVQLI